MRIYYTQYELVVIYYTHDIKGGTPLFHSAAASRCLFDRLIPPCASVLVVGLARTTSSRVQEHEALYWGG